MDIVNIGRSRRFLKERPIRVTLFDRPRLVCDLICLEPGQTEKRRGLDTSDSLYVVVEGEARLVSGAQAEALQAQDAALIPPGVDHTIENTGTERLTLMALVTPKPSRAGEVRMPVERQPRGRGYRTERPAEREGAEAAAAEEPSERPRREYDERRLARPYTPRPPRGGDRPSREARPQRAPARGPRAAGPPREGEAEGPAWFPRPKAPWRPRGGPPARRGGRPSYPRGAAGGPAPHRRPPGDERESLPEERPRRTRFTGPPSAGESRPARRGRTGARPTAGGRAVPPRGAPRGRATAPGEGAARPRSGRGRPVSGGPPRGGGGPRGQVGGGGEERPRGRGAARGAGSPRPAPRGSRPSGPRGQGRNGPRTSGPRPTP